MPGQAQQQTTKNPRAIVAQNQVDLNQSNLPPSNQANQNQAQQLTTKEELVAKIFTPQFLLSLSSFNVPLDPSKVSTTQSQEIANFLRANPIWLGIPGRPKDTWVWKLDLLSPAYNNEKAFHDKYLLPDLTQNRTSGTMLVTGLSKDSARVLYQAMNDYCQRQVGTSLHEVFKLIAESPAREMFFITNNEYDSMIDTINKTPFVNDTAQRIARDRILEGRRLIGYIAQIPEASYSNTLISNLNPSVQAFLKNKNTEQDRVKQVQAQLADYLINETGIFTPIPETTSIQKTWVMSEEKARWYLQKPEQLRDLVMNDSQKLYNYNQGQAEGLFRKIETDLNSIFVQAGYGTQAKPLALALDACLKKRPDLFLTRQEAQNLASSNELINNPNFNEQQKAVIYSRL